MIRRHLMKEVAPALKKRQHSTGRASQKTRSAFQIVAAAGFRRRRAGLQTACVGAVLRLLCARRAAAPRNIARSIVRALRLRGTNIRVVTELVSES